MRHRNTDIHYHKTFILSIQKCTLVICRVTCKESNIQILISEGENIKICFLESYDVNEIQIIYFQM